jgi:N-acetylmuramic acid 6-phosphate etherase
MNGLHHSELLLGVEGGGTRTVALLVGNGNLIRRAELGPGNVRLLADASLLELFASAQASINAPLPELTGLCLGMAGARTLADRQRILAAAQTVWPSVPCYATDDLETALAAAGPATRARVLVLSGTGSCCYGRKPDGKTARFGGWGHLLGDAGSGYDLAIRALRAVIDQFDLTGKWPALGQRILATLQLNAPSDLIDWVKNADKARVASLTKTIFEAAAANNRLARSLTAAVARDLAEDGVHCARKLGAVPVEFILAGGLLRNQPAFARQVGLALRKLRPGSTVNVLERESAWGAVELARLHVASAPAARYSADAPKTPVDPSRDTPFYIPVSTRMSPTEERNPNSMRLDAMPLGDAIELFAREDASIPRALLSEKTKFERVIEFVVNAIKTGGRLFYVGAGTSGRLGVLDASEIPPTFRAPPEWVQGIMAGGFQALWKSVEGAEDDPLAGAEATRFRGIAKNDVVIGIAASGRTPFVWGALHAARDAGAATILLCFNPHLDVAATAKHTGFPTLVIAPNLGPEILTGSTRLKAGTATKLALNMITTLAMVRLGKVVSNLMTDLNPSNAKLRDRAIRIVQAIAGLDRPQCEAALVQHHWNVKAACEALRH